MGCCSAALQNGLSAAGGLSGDKKPEDGGLLTQAEADAAAAVTALSAEALAGKRSKDGQKKSKKRHKDGESASTKYLNSVASRPRRCARCCWFLRVLLLFLLVAAWVGGAMWWFLSRWGGTAELHEGLQDATCHLASGRYEAGPPSGQVYKIPMVSHSFTMPTLHWTVAPSASCWVDLTLPTGGGAGLLQKGGLSLMTFDYPKKWLVPTAHQMNCGHLAMQYAAMAEGFSCAYPPANFKGAGASVFAASREELSSSFLFQLTIASQIGLPFFAWFSVTATVIAAVVVLIGFCVVTAFVHCFCSCVKRCRKGSDQEKDERKVKAGKEKRSKERKMSGDDVAGKISGAKERKTSGADGAKRISGSKERKVGRTRSNSSNGVANRPVARSRCRSCCARSVKCTRSLLVFWWLVILTLGAVWLVRNHGETAEFYEHLQDSTCHLTSGTFQAFVPKSHVFTIPFLKRTFAEPILDLSWTALPSLSCWVSLSGLPNQDAFKNADGLTLLTFDFPQDMFHLDSHQLQCADLVAQYHGKAGGFDCSSASGDFTDWGTFAASKADLHSIPLLDLTKFSQTFGFFFVAWAFAFGILVLFTLALPLVGLCWYVRRHLAVRRHRRRVAAREVSEVSFDYQMLPSCPMQARGAATADRGDVPLLSEQP